METAHIPDAWKLAPTLVAIGIDSDDLECARAEFPGSTFADCLNWLEALVSSQQLVGMIEESIGRVSDLVHAVKTYAYEGKGTRRAIDVNDSIHATLVILGHKIREKQIVLEKQFGADLPPLETDCSGLNQVWTNLLDNAIDAVAPGGSIQIKTWAESRDGKHLPLHPHRRQRRRHPDSSASRTSSTPSTPPRTSASAPASASASSTASSSSSAAPSASPRSPEPRSSSSASPAPAPSAASRSPPSKPPLTRVPSTGAPSSAHVFIAAAEVGYRLRQRTTALAHP